MGLLEPRVQTLEMGQDALHKRVEKLESQHEEHDRALFGFTDGNGQWNDGLVQHVADIWRFSGIAVDLLRVFVKWALPPIWAGVAALILFLLRAAYNDWIALHLHAIHG